MAQGIADRRDIDFVLYEQLDAEALIRFPKYGEFNRKLFDMTVSEARNFGIKEIQPTFSQGDRDGSAWKQAWSWCRKATESRIACMWKGSGSP